MCLIIFEGGDKSGKGTQAKLLAKMLREKGYPVEEIAFPNRSSPIGKLLNSYLKKELFLTPHPAHLLFSADRWETKGTIETFLKEGKIVIVDRYSASGIAYSVANGIDLEWCSQSERGLPTPDIVFFMQIKETTRRIGFGEELFEDKKFQEEVINKYRMLVDETWKIINCEQSIDASASEIFSHVISFLKGT